MLLDKKVAVVVGGGGTIGGAVARAFAAEGAHVVVAGRTRERLDAFASELSRNGRPADVAVLDALDERSVDQGFESIVARAGGIDICFTAIWHNDVHGTPLLAMPIDDFMAPITTATRAQFLITRAAARQMTQRRSGVIMGITATTARQSIPEVGGTGVTFDAMESQWRQWATELGPLGVRVVWLLTTGIPEALKSDVQPAYGTGNPLTRDQLIKLNSDRTMLRSLATLADVGAAAAWIASDAAKGMTGAAINLTYGAIPTR